MVPVSTLIERSIRNMGNVHPLVRSKITEVISEAYKEGIRVQISSGYRSFARQAELYAQGRTDPGNIVTNAEPGESVHNYGLAVDYFLVSKDGTDSIWTVNSDWIRVAELAKAKGFEWGGDWDSFVDYPHLQLTEGLSWRDLQSGKRPSFWGNYEIGGHIEHETKIAGEMIQLALYQGDNGTEVRELQKKLQRFGYYLNGEIDGSYGPKTEAAVKEFQRDYDLKVDGIAGPHTLGKLAALESNTAVFTLGGETYQVKKI